LSHTCHHLDIDLRIDRGRITRGVAGRAVVRDGQIVSVDLGEVIARQNRLARALADA
jgi:hypothetical protein